MKTVGYLAASCAAGLALGAGTSLTAGAAAAAVPAATGTTAARQQHRAPAPIGRGRVLTNADNGHSVTVRPGETVTVRLTGHRNRGVTFSWGAPRSGDVAVLRQTDGGTAPTGDATGRFRAGRRGTARISAQRTCRAGHGHVCPHVVVPWRVTVKVS
ncbi:hypothetical protein GCM10010211_27720 [Streptomyces albospinus]|uniref:Uncharacterized protein n=1 Tax=Streptomyces albospinus TaxID=285515 RepID=A0ABQ2V0I9_9ACTN|nr:hypothetical protein [Streptomyces albospinus]GGU61232.1 hypothetical protein GCM10010211_27720 [Streptomyces albospinus]